MFSNTKLDNTRKVTISLGGSCKLRCKHCYITASQFRYQRYRTVEDIAQELKEIPLNHFDAICISGDTDPLLQPDKFTILLKKLANEFPSKHIMFTTRLVPEKRVFEKIKEVGRRIINNGRLFVPAVSLVTYSYPNTIEDKKKVPHTKQRLEFLNLLRDTGFTTLAALRPTFPFEIVPKKEVRMLVQSVQSVATSILGEIFILDQAGEIASQLQLPPPQQESFISPMSFQNQESYWEKRSFTAEISFIKQICAEFQIPFFLRSMSAIRLFENFWDPSIGKLKLSDPSTIVNYEDLLP